MDLNIQELTIINELSLTVGLIMLTIELKTIRGLLLGWDPRDLGLISIMIYAL